MQDKHLKELRQHVHKLQKCNDELCWLCLRDYRKYTKETGKGLCNTYEDVFKLRRAGEQNYLKRILFEMKKLEQYYKYFTEH